MPPLKPVAGRKVWRVSMEPKRKWITKDLGLVALFGGKMFTTKDLAERFALRAALKWTDLFGHLIVEEYTCTGREGNWIEVQSDTPGWLLTLHNPPRRKHARSRRRARG